MCRAWLVKEAVEEVAELCGAQGILPVAVERYIITVVNLFPVIPHPVHDYTAFNAFCEAIVFVVGYYEEA